jgi:hypothetical protein
LLLFVFCSPCHQNRDNNNHHHHHHHNHHQQETKEAGDKEEECVSNKEVSAMMKAMTELFIKNQQSTDTTLERVECSIVGIIDRVESLDTGCQQRIKTRIPTTLMRMTTTMRRWGTRSPSTLHVHHHDSSTVMSSRCTNRSHALHVDQIGKVWEATLIVALINSTLAVMMILFAKVKFMIPPFYGLYDAKAYLDWEMTVNNKFSSHLVPKQYHVRQATSEFKDFAIIWWNKLSSLHIKLDTWDRLKATMRKRFVPPAYQRGLRKKLQHLDQGDVQDYYAELQKSMTHAGVHEETEDKICHFYSRLHTKIQDIIDYREYNTINHLFQLAMLAKKEL